MLPDTLIRRLRRVAPATPDDEEARLRALARYDVLDTPTEEAFDAITRIVAHVMDVPIALVSLVDADRQWFKSRHGLDAIETPRDVSFCGHVVAAGAPLVVRDAWTDDRFADNPLVTGEPRVRFYCGVPLRTPDGHVLGTLCAIDHVPRTVSRAQEELLAALSAQVIALLELRWNERLLRERALAQHQRLVTTGTLAAGIGHEINNPLAVVTANVDFAREELRALALGAPTGRVAEILEVLGDALDGADRIRRIVRALRALHEGRADPVLASPTESVETALALAMGELRRRARVVKELAPVPDVWIEPGRLAQALVNLLLNAAQAFDGLDREVEATIIVRTRTDGSDRIAIEIIDDGVGIDPADLPHIFDPFFTTKPVGHGRGLGLSISRGIVSALGGEILVESAPNRGSTFRVLLPVHHEPPLAQ